MIKGGSTVNEFLAIAPDVKLGKDVKLSQFINLYGCEIGDGLVSQIPALLVSTSSGMVITRAAEDDDLGKQVATQAFMNKSVLIGTAVATLVGGKWPSGCAAAFFEGAGYAFAHIISLIVVANCFGEGVRQIGLARELSKVILAAPNLLLPLAALVAMTFAWLCGSGMASTQSLFESFAAPALQLGIDPAMTFLNGAGRPMYVLDERETVKELLS